MLTSAALRSRILSSQGGSTTEKHGSTWQSAWLAGEWAEAIQHSRSAFGAHSLQRTKVPLIHERTGNLRAVQVLLGHHELESARVDAKDEPTRSETIEA